MVKARLLNRASSPGNSPRSPSGSFNKGHVKNGSNNSSSSSSNRLLSVGLHSGSPLSSRMKAVFIMTHVTLFGLWTFSVLNPEWSSSMSQMWQTEFNVSMPSFGSSAGEVFGEPATTATTATATSSTTATADATSPVARRYNELAGLIEKKAQKHRYEYLTAYTQSKAGVHKETCSVEKVAIPLEQDEHNLINTLDAHDLADVTLQHYASAGHLHFFADSFRPEMAPCLLPGTIISIENHCKAQQYFFQKIRPHITVSYILITSESDGNSPEDGACHYGENMRSDPLLLKWYGTNPDFTAVDRYNGRSKFVPMPLGLAKFHRQTPYLHSYLALNNYSAPFGDKNRWLGRLDELDKATADNLNDFLFVKFNVHQYAKHRKQVHDMLCNGIQSPDGVSCSDQSFSPHHTYNASSQYLFGMSPPGAGWDCYRTYELLLAGVIPLIEERAAGRALFADMPVIHVPNLVTNTSRTRDDFLTIIRDYVHSDEFQMANFTAGWERFFLRYWRRMILKDAGRDGEILTDPKTGREYYLGYRYTATPRPERIYCGQSGSCESNR